MGIDLNTVEEEEAPPQATAVCAELWHACAGPGVALPRLGSAVVYLPQGHLAAGGGEVPPASVPVPPHVVCRVVGVELCADAATDGVYARFALVAEDQMFRQNFRSGEEEMEGDDGENRPRMPHMFCKTLTASDTSTHGGFSVPRRAAEDCFEPLDYKQTRPSQELIAKDLHGIKWKFRHIYRGQPRRHLLTTGWSSFVNRKKLVSGDAVLFLLGNDGELRLGVRRAIQFRNEALLEAVNSNESKLRTLSSLASSLENRSIFHVCVNPRSGASEYIVPYWKFSKSLNHPFSIGMRFKFRYESEDTNERLSGLISGIGEVDPIRWPGSKWRCLLVSWDNDTDCNRQTRVSPWEIERVGGTISVTHCMSASSSKRTKLYFPQGKLDAPVIDGNGCLDSMETENFHRVLQGQELMGPRAHGVTCSQSPDLTKFQTSDRRRSSPNMRSCMLHGSTSGLPQQHTEFAYQSLGFSESVRFSEVLQGQEMSQGVPFFQGTTYDARKLNGGAGSFRNVHRSAIPSGLLAETQRYPLPQFTLPTAKVSSPSSVLMVNQVTTPHLESEGRGNHRGTYGSQCAPLEMVRTEIWPFVQPQNPTETGCHQFNTGKTPPTPEIIAHSGSATREVRRSNCRLFGFSLTDKIPGADEEVAKNGNTEADRQNPRVLELFGHSHSTPSALQALCAAPLGM